MTDVNGGLREFVTAGRTAHALLCVDTVTVSEVTRGALNPTTLLYATTSTTVYTGAARVKRVMSQGNIVGETQRMVARVVVDLPYSATGADALKSGHLVTVTASLDEALVGKVLTVIGPEHGSTSTARRYTVEEVSP